MNYEEALQWLEERGGAWSVRATVSACAVVATLGPTEIVADTQQLSARNVEEALVDAVSRIQRAEPQPSARAVAHHRSAGPVT